MDVADEFKAEPCEEVRDEEDEEVGEGRGFDKAAEEEEDVPVLVVEEEVEETEPPV